MLARTFRVSRCARFFGTDPIPRKLPILMLTAKAGEADRVVGLEMGADDYLPNHSARAKWWRACARSCGAPTAPHSGRTRAVLTKKASLRSISALMRFLRAAQTVKLTLKEFELLRFLVQNPNRVLSRDQLLDRVWGGETFVTPRTVDVHIRRLRKAIEKDDSKPRMDSDASRSRL